MVLNLFINFVIIIVTVVSCQAAFNSNKQSSDDPSEITKIRSWKFVHNEIVILPTGKRISLEELIKSINEQDYKINGDDENVYNYKYIKDNFFRTALATRLLKYICLISEYAFRLNMLKGSNFDDFKCTLRTTLNRAKKYIEYFREEYFWENETDLEKKINNLANCLLLIYENVNRSGTIDAKYCLTLEALIFFLNSLFKN
ncbi:uncharacterized protein LOC126894582 [Daktulosphaira vitifoliae]|uniref:uncharacterized protein LOC126894582 n=1 Tax=Daktulosphaira vitifoliae TaxID=58002 RepID=UPI0021A98F47|nr:uncharacterized protein LOC126894582 [Daktulosphaira vitifoliae]